LSVCLAVTTMSCRSDAKSVTVNTLPPGNVISMSGNDKEKAYFVTIKTKDDILIAAIPKHYYVHINRGDTIINSVVKIHKKTTTVRRVNDTIYVVSDTLRVE
jgi:hypothetical protein